MAAIKARPSEARELPSPTLCHGLGGLLQVALRFAQAEPEDTCAALSEELVEELVEQYDPDALMGFRALELDDNWTDNPGLLDGAPGVALALLAAFSEVEPCWDRLFLLS